MGLLRAVVGYSSFFRVPEGSRVPKGSRVPEDSRVPEGSIRGLGEE